MYAEMSMQNDLLKEALGSATCCAIGPSDQWTTTSPTSRPGKDLSTLLLSSTFMRVVSLVGGLAVRPMRASFWMPLSKPFINASQHGINSCIILIAGRKYTERLAEAKIAPSVGSVGGSYDNALAETINGLFKAEVIHRRGPWRSFEAVEYATLEWIDWFNNRRLLEPIGNIPPAEAETNFYAALERSDIAA